MTKRGKTKRYSLNYEKLGLPKPTRRRKREEVHGKYIKIDVSIPLAIIISDNYVLLEELAKH